MGHTLWIRELVRIIRTQATRGSRRGYMVMVLSFSLKPRETISYVNLGFVNSLRLRNWILFRQNICDSLDARGKVGVRSGCER